jgi:DNA polymerase-3 subunit gamma/tau
MFDAIIGQAASAQLAEDLSGSRLAPSMLFAGPRSSGKGAAALELARLLSCERGGAEGCACPSCARHRILAHPDALCLGSRAFSAEIAASAAAFARNPKNGPLFTRALRKLLLRFTPVLWEDDPKFGKLSSLVLDLDEDVEEIAALKDAEAEKRQKRSEAIVKDALKLEAEGMSDTIPIGQIRKAAAWAHLAPNGKRKFLLIENADRMQEGARNSLLKILEEPPESVVIVLTTAHEQALLPTILSRLRPYRFVKRPPEVEAEVIRMVFGEDAAGNIGAEGGGAGNMGGAGKGGQQGIDAYLGAFLSVPDAALRPLAAFYAVSIAKAAALALKVKAREQPPELIALGKLTAPIAKEAGFTVPVANAYVNTQAVIGKVLESAQKFEIRGLFPRFLQIVLSYVSESLKDAEIAGEKAGATGVQAGFSPAGFLDIWTKYAEEAGTAVGIYNQRPGLALERLAIAVAHHIALIS